MRLPYDTLAADGMDALAATSAYIHRSGLEKSLVDLVYLRASQINGCAYCIDRSGREAIAAGASVQKLLLVSAWRETDVWFTQREQAALNWTEIVTWIAGNQVPDEAFLAAQEAFTDKELADLTLAIGLINVQNRMAISFRRTPALVPDTQDPRRAT
jgi:AhpD family alkylhydroperoxidase